MFYLILAYLKNKQLSHHNRGIPKRRKAPQKGTKYFFFKVENVHLWQGWNNIVKIKLKSSILAIWKKTKTFLHCRIVLTYDSLNSDEQYKTHSPEKKRQEVWVNIHAGRHSLFVLCIYDLSTTCLCVRPCLLMILFVTYYSTLLIVSS